MGAAHLESSEMVLLTLNDEFCPKMLVAACRFNSYCSNSRQHLLWKILHVLHAFPCDFPMCKLCFGFCSVSR